MKKKWISTSSCPKCGKSNVEDASYCNNCGASLSGALQPVASKQFQFDASTYSSPSFATSTGIPRDISPNELPPRLEKALRRAEFLSYTAIALSVLVLILLILSIV